MFVSCIWFSQQWSESGQPNEYTLRVCEIQYEMPIINFFLATAAQMESERTIRKITNENEKKRSEKKSQISKHKLRVHLRIRTSNVKCIYHVHANKKTHHPTKAIISPLWVSALNSAIVPSSTKHTVANIWSIRITNEHFTFDNQTKPNRTKPSQSSIA